MKIFAYDPATGKRGKLLDNIRIASWTSESLPAGDFKVPPNTASKKHTVHKDAGIFYPETGQQSYRRKSEWVCFCLGEFRSGQDSGYWGWVILPSTDYIEGNGIAQNLLTMEKDIDPDEQLLGMLIGAMESYRAGEAQASETVKFIRQLMR